MDPTTTKIQYSPYYIYNITLYIDTLHCTYYFFVYYYTADILYYLDLLRIYNTATIYITLYKGFQGQQ